MFTGIVETLAKVEKIEHENTNVNYTFSSAITQQLKIDQSVAHNGVCLTIIKIKNNTYTVTAINETLKRTNLSLLAVGDLVNIERCMPGNGRFDGHIVQGHVDTTAQCIKVKDLKGSWEFTFKHALNKNNITVTKGSVTVSGVSLTVVKSTKTTFSVCIIPYTFENTNFKTITVGSIVNIEFDIIGKYVAKLLEKRHFK